MALSDHVHIARRFQRSIRIDSDLGGFEALDGFICTSSSAEVLLSMANHIKENKQGAFTWTGPYGCGKSSLAVALSALLGSDEKLRKIASVIVGKKVVSSISETLPLGNKGWRILPIVGRREQPAHLFGEALNHSGFVVKAALTHWTDTEVLKTVKDIAQEKPTEFGGLIVFIDEMGKLLEGASYENTDINFFQDLAESASRSNKRLIIVGILHQSFAEYGARLSREMRDEWSKIQGRFADLPINSAGEEQIELISRAIESDCAHDELKPQATKIANLILHNKPAVSMQIARTLEECWPLHPVVACLLGPISRRRFGQNQRSIFGFLNSAEPQGFQDFIRNAPEGKLYEPYKLWDYLRINLEPTILASPDGHRWAIAAEAIERCEVIGGSITDLRLLKTIALIDLFKERSGLSASIELLNSCFNDTAQKEIPQSIKQLKAWSFILYKKFDNSFSIYAGSDFDIDQAVEESLEHTKEVDFNALRTLAGIQPILAKRYYHKTGALWWFDVEVVPVKDLMHATSGYEPRPGTIGQFLLAIPTEGETKQVAEQLCHDAAHRDHKWDVIVGISPRTWGITSLAQELLAIEKVLNERVELAGDAVARREVSARLASLQGMLEAELNLAFTKATWYLKDHEAKEQCYAELNLIASGLADKRFYNSPIIHNELLNRIKPSGSAVSAQNALLRCMVLNEGKDRLGIQGYPAEGGLFASLLEATELYQHTDQGWRFVSPDEQNAHNLFPMWEKAREILIVNSHRSVPVSELFEEWNNGSFGIKNGLLPVLAVAFILSERPNLAFYREGIFQPKFKDLDVEYLANNASDIQLRWMNLSDMSRRLLSEMADIVRQLDCTKELINLEPIDVARGLIAVFVNLQPWVKKTQRLSKNAIRIRTLFNHANDPNKFLFDDIPEMFGIHSQELSSADLSDVITNIRDGLEELVQAFPALLHQLRDTLFAELQVPNASPRALAELRDRAENIKQVTGDHTLESLILRLSRFTGTDEDIESVASITFNKLARDWIDSDIDRATLELADLAQRFLRAESFARVKGRQDKRHAIAVIIGMDGRPTPVRKEFHITDSDKKEVSSVLRQLQTALKQSGQKHENIILAALAELSASYMKSE